VDLQQLYSHLKDLPAKAFMPIWDGVLPQDLRVYLQGNKIIITYHTYEDDYSMGLICKRSISPYLVRLEVC